MIVQLHPLIIRLTYNIAISIIRNNEQHPPSLNTDTV